MTELWSLPDPAPAVGMPGGTVTLVEGAAFCISASNGDIAPDVPQGLFFRDTRFLSEYSLRINEHQPEPLSADSITPFSAVFVTRARPRTGRADSTLVVFRYRYVGRGMREDIVIRNYDEEPAYCSIELRIGCDFADLYRVKEGRFGPEGTTTLEASASGLTFDHRHGRVRRGATITLSEPASFVGTVATMEAIVPAHGTWSTCLQITTAIEDEVIEPRYVCGQPVEHATPQARLERWRRDVPAVETDYDQLKAVVRRSAEDLGALRIFDPDFPERTVVAAGAPWFMTLFGRDSILTSYMALIVDPELALGVLQTLARFQGEKVDARFEEEPGRILHEMRFGSNPSLSLGGGRVYYGSADATPLFVVLLGELRRWGLAREVVDSLLPHADRALDWIQDYGDRDGDGYVEYKRATDQGLVNQGWKDSWDAIRFGDGTLAKPPVALAEVQGYVYMAYLARAHFADEAGDEATSTKFRTRAAALKTAFNRDFWLDDKGWYAMGLDADKRPLDALASNMGHCLWTGIVDQDRARAVADHLLSPEMFTGWGVRTLGENMVGYNPISYHVGSVWPHDNAIIASGLMRYGFVEEAQRIIVAMLDAAGALGNRLPELFGGLSRSDLPFPVAYPSSCSPQAWAAASPLLFLRTLLRLDPWVPHGQTWLDPVLPAEIGYLRVDRIPLAGRRVTVECDRDSVKMEGLPPDIEWVHRPRDPLTKD